MTNETKTQEILYHSNGIYYATLQSDSDHIAYFLNGKYHRDDGPAIEFLHPEENDFWEFVDNGDIGYGGFLTSYQVNKNSHQWYLAGKRYSFNEWCSSLSLDNSTIAYFKLKFLP